MIPIPAIDLKDGKVVRLLQGKFKEEKVYFDNPKEIARRFESEGASRIHVVDLDGALKGEPKNLGSVETILKTVKTPLEVGGGIRDLKAASRLFEIGVRWVILGTKACLDQGFLSEAVREFKDKIIVGIDALDGMVATDGWTKVTKNKAIEFAKATEALGAKTVIYTDISKDGMLAGPSFAQVKNLCREVTMDIIASGGVGSLAHLEEFAALGEPKLKGVIIGKALYENKFTLEDAVRVCSQKG